MELYICFYQVEKKVYERPFNQRLGSQSSIQFGIAIKDKILCNDIHFAMATNQLAI